MPKVDLSTVMGILQANEVPAITLKKVELGLQEAAKEEKEDKDPAEQPAYEPLLISTTTGALNDDSPFFVLEFDSKKMNHVEAIENFKRLIWEHNDKTKSKAKRASSIGEAFQFVPGVLLKQAGFKIKFKMPLILSKTENQIKNA